MDFLTPEVLALVPIIVGLVEVIKRAGMNVKYAPIVAILIGVAGVLGLTGVSIEAVIGGVVVGLSAVGLFSSGRTALQG
jgi:hypothetical protein